MYTGSVYNYGGLIKGGFPGERYTDGRVIAVKTHHSGLQDKDKFRRVVLLLRNPFDAILAEFNRQKAKGQTKTINREAFNAEGETRNIN